MASFAAASGRLFVVQNQLMISSRELEKNLALLQGITEGTTQGGLQQMHQHAIDLIRLHADVIDLCMCACL